MTDYEVIGVLLDAKSGRTDYEAFDIAEQAILKLDKIKTITERALRSSDPINLYKARCIKEIAEVLGVKAPDPDKADSKGQITIDDII
jgi:hypothetical protein